MADIDTTDPVEPTADGVSEVPGEPPLRIFINYRREDMPFAGTLLSGELERRFGAENIFFDTRTLQPGMPFHEEIKAHLNGTAGAFIALIGPNWQATMDAHRRLNDHDYVVEEIELALRNGWTIIPMLLNNATLPELTRLPRSIRALRDYQAARLRLDSPGGDIDNLIAHLEEISAQPVRAASDPGPVIMTPPESTASSSVEVPDIQPPATSTTRSWLTSSTTWSSSSARAPTPTTTGDRSSPAPRCSPTTRTSPRTWPPRPGSRLGGGNWRRSRNTPG